eukprot:CAMPEP_0116013360 /NCGR_PEP_ID=MMETSP0321-20121206/5683_1 /TAXON_ID=163516 /ORGANISM="Leptocylindrus danicus var. danicus, Strain B650" /LENGTH=375 /DNA_ID=CAMNT_0003482901 /DNA_START=164 /DNA_END=1291 /DNA_ORIENTATION=-
MKNEEVWKGVLPEKEILEKISKGTKVLREGEEMAHGASGFGCWGKLSSLGVLQMIKLGDRLREDLHSINGIFSTDQLKTQNLRVVSTDFPRTIQSVQCLLVGLFPDGVPNGECIEIDVRHTNKMIPDPQPRRYKLQEDLEKELAMHPDIIRKEEEMYDLAVQVSKALVDVLADGASAVSFGIGEEKEGVNDSNVPGVNAAKPLPWGQLSEITKCLRVRNLLPVEISHEMQEKISEHAAWRWFSMLRHPILSSIAMDTMVSEIIQNAHKGRDGNEEFYPLHIYSAHDSTLIGLMCALRLEQPSQWPEYASALKIEIFEVECEEENNSSGFKRIRRYCRFSLNDTILSCTVGGASSEAVCLDELSSVLYSCRNGIEV